MAKTPPTMMQASTVEPRISDNHNTTAVRNMAAAMAAVMANKASGPATERWRCSVGLISCVVFVAIGRSVSGVLLFFAAAADLVDLLFDEIAQ